MFAFSAKRKAVQATCSADGVETVLASGEQFMNVRLVADVPDEFVFRGGKNDVQRESQLDDAKVRTQMAAVLGKLRDQLVAHLIRQLDQLRLRQLFDVRRVID